MNTDEAHQIECRWLQGRDLAPIASSFTDRPELAEQWFEALRSVARPAQPGQGGASPEASVAYLMFDQQMAALIWRQWTIDAIALDVGSGRRPLVARILIGSQNLLSPDVAICLCRAGVMGLTGPPPGQVMPGSQLPAMMPEQLSGLTGYARALERMARQESGLDLLIAAALREPCTPLSVLLPLSEVGEPASGHQAPLLWGLRQTIGMLIDNVAGMPEGARSWSFSTFERPFDATTTDRLPDIVFRVQQQAQPAAVVRQEITVLPRDRDEQRPDTYGELAIALAAAYRAMGSEELTSRLEPVTQKAELSNRLDVAYDLLRDFLPVPAASDAPQPERAAAEPEPGSPESAQLSPASASDDGEDLRAEEPQPVADRPTTVKARRAKATEYEPRHEPERPRTDARPSRKGRHLAQTPEPITDLLESLAAGPGELHFMRALKTLESYPSQLSAQERADARSLMAQRGWCIPGLNSYDPQQIEPTLAAVFRVVLIPDLSHQVCQAELGGWAADWQAPAPVIRSLIAAARQAGPYEERLLQSALQPALSRRWLAEHAVYPGSQLRMPAETAVAQSQPPEQSARPRWQIFSPGPHNAAVASLLAWFCAALLIALIVISVLR